MSLTEMPKGRHIIHDVRMAHPDLGLSLTLPVEERFLSRLKMVTLRGVTLESCLKIVSEYAHWLPSV